MFVSWERTDIVSGIFFFLFFRAVFVSWERTDIVSGIFFSRPMCLMGENRHSVCCLFFAPCLSHGREQTGFLLLLLLFLAPCLSMGENRQS